MRRRANVGLMLGQRRFFTLQSGEFFYDNLGGQRSFFEFEIFINDSVSSFRFIWITMLWVYGHIGYFHSYSAGVDFRRRNLTSKVDPHTAKVTFHLLVMRIVMPHRALF